MEVWMFPLSLCTREARVNPSLEGSRGSHTHIPASPWLVSPEPASETSYGRTGQLHHVAGHTSAFHVIWEDMMYASQDSAGPCSLWG